MDPSAAALQLFQTLRRGPIKENGLQEQYHNALRTYDSLKSNPQNFCSMHVILMDNPDVNIRQIVLTFFYGKMFEHQNMLYLKLSPQYRDALNVTILTKMSNEASTTVLHSYMGALEKMYNTCIINSIPFPQFVPAIFQILQQGDRDHKNYILHLMEKIIVSIPIEEMRGVFDLLVVLLKQIIGTNDGDLMTNAIAVIKELIHYAYDNQDISSKAFQLYPLIHQVTMTVIQNEQHENYWVYVFEIEQQVFEVYIPQLVEYIPMTLDLALKVCNLEEDEHYDVDVHTTAMELVTIIYEIYYKEMKTARDLQQRTFETIINWLCDVDDIPEWYTNEEDLEDTPYYYQAEEVIERLTHMIGASNFVNFLIQHASLLKSEDWKQRLAFITSLNAALTSKKSSIAKVVHSLCQIIFPTIRDPHARVRNAVLSFATRIFKFYPATQIDIAEGILQILGSGLMDRIPRNQSRACDLASSFISSLTPQQLSPHLGTFLRIITPLIQSEDAGVVAEALCSLSNIILKMKTGVDEFFVQVIPVLKSVLDSTADYDDMFEVKGRVIEMISIVAIKLKKENANICTQIIVQEIQKVMNIQHLEVSNPLFGYIETSFTRLAEVLKDQCAPMLPIMLPIILKRVNLDIVAQFEYCETQKIMYGDEVLNVYIEAADEKVNAINSISDLANDLKNVFSPYVEQCLKDIIPLICLKASIKVRIASIRCSVNLVAAYISGKEREMGDLNKAMIAATPYCSRIIETVIANLNKELIVEVIYEQLLGLQHIIDCNRIPLGKQQLDSIIEMLKLLLVNFIQRSELNNDNSNTKDDDVDDSADEETHFCFNYRSLLNTLASSLPQIFVPSFQNILMPILKAALTTNGVSLKVIGFVALIFSTVSVSANQNSYISDIVSIIVKLASTKNPEILLQCVESISLLVQTPFIQPYLQQIMEIIKYCLSLKEENKELYNYSVMVLGKCISFNIPQFNQEIVLSWLCLLPINSYADDILFSLFTIYHRSNYIPLSQETITKTLTILIHCLASKDSALIRSSTKDLVTEQLKLWFQNNGPLIEPIWERATPQEKELLNELLQ